jgi:hypothetical protein
MDVGARRHLATRAKAVWYQVIPGDLRSQPNDCFESAEKVCSEALAGSCPSCGLRDSLSAYCPGNSVVIYWPPGLFRCLRESEKIT